MKFSEKLQYLRKSNNMSQEKLADMLDVSRQSVSKWESGQTYPEMDKLISMCSIFKCTLDDLTNDEITEININKKNKNVMSNFIDEALEIIRNSVDMFKNMSFKSIITCIIELLFVVLILVLFNLPVNYIYNLGNEIFMNFGIKAGSILSSIWRFILQVSYLILAIIIFIYIYKIKFLDKYSYNKEPKKVTTNNLDENDLKTKNTIYEKRDNSYAIFNVLGKLAIWSIKFIILFISIPFIIAMFILTASFIIGIVFLFNKILYFGPVLMVIACIILDYLILELIFNFMFNREINKKKIFIFFISSIITLGVGFGISVIEVANTKFIDNIPNNVKEKVITKEYMMNDNLFLINDWYSNIEYIVDETLNDKIKIEITYYNDYSDVILSDIDENTGGLTIHRYNKYKTINNKMINLILDNLKNKTIYNYENLYSVNVKIYTSNKNIDIMNKNQENYNNIIIENERLEKINYYNNKLGEYQTIINEKDTQIYDLENKNQELEQQLQEYEIKIQEFKNALE